MSYQLINTASWPLTPDVLLELLQAMDIPYTHHHHPAFFTAAEGTEFEAGVPGAHGRNLFLRDQKKTRYFLVTARNETAIDLKKLAGALDAGKLSFASADDLWNMLGVRPGSVCPYAIINDRNKRVILVLEAAMMQVDGPLNFHPLVNTQTIGVDPDDMLKLLTRCDIRPLCLDMQGLAPG
ncbi:MAG: prolyl-tRNA synthetase associated domain-containing protein [Pseudomonadota bacterium]